jgi:hypothetical protein
VTGSVLGAAFMCAGSTANRATGNWLHDELDVGRLLTAYGTDNLASGNQILADAQDHPAIEVGGTGNTVVANELRGAGLGITNPEGPPEPGGMNVLTAGNRLGRNLVLTTLDGFGTRPALGIFAVPGTIDLGGNRAALSTDPRQCVGIVCGTYP